MGVSKTHRINLSMWILIYSFSDTYYVWAACGPEVNFLVHLQSFACKIFFHSQTGETTSKFFPYEMSMTISDIWCNENDSSKTTRNNSNTRMRMCGTEPRCNTAGQWLTKNVLFSTQRPLFYLPQMSSTHSLLRSNGFLQMFGRRGWF